LLAWELGALVVAGGLGELRWGFGMRFFVLKKAGQFLGWPAFCGCSFGAFFGPVPIIWVFYFSM